MNEHGPFIDDQYIYMYEYIYIHILKMFLIDVDFSKQIVKFPKGK